MGSWGACMGACCCCCCCCCCRRRRFTCPTASVSRSHRFEGSLGSVRRRKARTQLDLGPRSSSSHQGSCGCASSYVPAIPRLRATSHEQCQYGCKADSSSRDGKHQHERFSGKKRLPEDSSCQFRLHRSTQRRQAEEPSRNNYRQQSHCRGPEGMLNRTPLRDHNILGTETDNHTIHGNQRAHPKVGASTAVRSAVGQEEVWNRPRRTSVDGCRGHPGSEDPVVEVGPGWPHLVNLGLRQSTAVWNILV
mmetsp:Transcript_71895/g.156616  ORF Transcript_71895/g.156616 Transcript_71895/m.156616 type:complete len:249 (-) Transcript_71895:2020-2766(-)